MGMGVEPKIRVFNPPNHPFVHRVFISLFSPSILGIKSTPIFGSTPIYTQLSKSWRGCVILWPLPVKINKNKSRYPMTDPWDWYIIFTYIWLIFMVNVGIHVAYMDPIWDIGTPRKFNSLPLKDGGWKTILSYWVPVTFQGGAVKLREGIPLWP